MAKVNAHPGEFPPWRSLVRLSERVTFADVAQEAGVPYHQVWKMSLGQIPTSREVQDALARVFGHPAEELAEALRLQLSIFAEDGDGRG